MRFEILPHNCATVGTNQVKNMINSKITPFLPVEIHLNPC